MTPGRTRCGRPGRRTEALEEARQQAEEEEDTKSASAVVLPARRPKEQADVLQEQESANQAAQADAGVQAQSITSAGKRILRNGELSWPVDRDVPNSYNMDKTVYFPTLQQYKYNPALIISGKVNDKVMAAARGKVTSIGDKRADRHYRYAWI